MATSQQNIQLLLSKGVSQEFIGSELAKGKSGAAKGSNIDDKDVAGFLNLWAQQPQTSQGRSPELQALFDALPDEIKNNPSFKNLSPDLQDVVAYNFDIQSKNDKDKAEKWDKAIEMAKNDADPYWKNIINIAQTEVQFGIDTANGGFQAANERLKKQMEYINEDLASNREFLSLEQQSELANLSADLTDKTESFDRNMKYMGAQKAAQLQGLEVEYKKSVDDINRNMQFSTEEKNAALKTLADNFKISMENVAEGKADAGLTFSTKRQIAEDRLREENKGLVESTTRQYNKSMADLGSNKDYINRQYQLQTGNVNTEMSYKQAIEESSMETATRLANSERDRLNRSYTKRIADLQTEAERGNEAAIAEIADLQRKLGESITGIGIEAEKKLGTDNLPKIEGYTPIGNVPGQVYEDRVADEEARTAGYFNELNQGSLNFEI